MSARFALLCLSLGGLRFSAACTTFAIGRKATADGSVIVSQSEDGDDLADARVIFVPAREYAPGAMAPVYYTDGPMPRWVSNDLGPGYKPNALTGPSVTTPIGYIPQVARTFAYWDSNFAIINEHNVGIGESTCSAMFYTCAKGDSRHCEEGRKSGEAIFDIRALTMFGLERAKTARQAIEIMGNLAYEYGFYGSHDPNGDGESLMVGDATEAWVFHILADPTGTKAIWAAVRVPDDRMTVVSNMFNIREVDVTDTENCMASSNIRSVAEERGWLKPDEVLDFTKVYSNGEYGNQYYSGRRMWRGMSLAAPSLDLPVEYNNLRYDRMWPWAVKPDKLLALQDVFSFYRDYLVGTKFDLTKGLAAGYGGTPDRFDTAGPVKGAWERSIALYRTNLAKVIQLKTETPELPKELAGVAWLCPGPAHYTPFLPVPSGLQTPLDTLANVEPFHFSEEAINWQARKVMMTAQIRFDHMHPLVEAKQKELEAAAEIALEQARRAILGEKSKSASWDEFFVAHAKAALATWRQLQPDMMFHYDFNSDISKISAKPSPYDSVGLDEDTASLSYPAWWLRAVGFSEGPPPPPVATQCPPVCGDTAQLLGMSETSRGFVMGMTFAGVVPGAILLVVGLAKRRSSSNGASETAPYCQL